MRIIVCVKQVGYIYHPTAIDLSSGEIDTEKMVHMLNPYDEVSVEEAVRIKEKFRDCEVVIITAGPPSAESTLRYAHAMGGDRMIRINFEGLDPWTTAQVLTGTISKMEYDLILCGKKAIDDEFGQVGAFVSEFLDIPQVSGIANLILYQNEKKAVVQRYMGKGDREEVECQLPALFTVEMGLNEPRYPTFPNRITSEKSDIEIIEPVLEGDACNDSDQLINIVSTSPPRPKTRKVFVPDSNLSGAERLNLMMTGGVTKKEGNDIVEGSDDQLADKIMEFLVKNNAINVNHSVKTNND